MRSSFCVGRPPTAQPSLKIFRPVGNKRSPALATHSDIYEYTNITPEKESPAREGYIALVLGSSSTYFTSHHQNETGRSTRGYFNGASRLCWGFGKLPDFSFYSSYHSDLFGDNFSEDLDPWQDPTIASHPNRAEYKFTKLLANYAVPPYDKFAHRSLTAKIWAIARSRRSPGSPHLITVTRSSRARCLTPPEDPSSRTRSLTSSGSPPPPTSVHRSAG